MSINPRVFQTTSDTRTPHRAVALATIVPEREPFMNFDPNSELSFEDKSMIYCSLITLVKAGYPFGKALQERAALFLKSLDSPFRASKQAAKLVTDLVPSSAGSPSGIIKNCLLLESLLYFSELGITTAMEKYSHREKIFQKVVLPSSQFVTFLISKRLVPRGDLFRSFMALLNALLRISPFHLPTMEFVLASPIVMALSNCLSIVVDWSPLEEIHLSMKKWNEQDPEVAQSGKKMIQALISEGFEDTLEQKFIRNFVDIENYYIIKTCLSISRLLGSNVECPEW
ncbi:hypothetical protein BLNAU_22575 [Blattamonas nauphoetae]|uniref:Uncharacterized protein n=1 Tax=Blattamonas nauphoetae TaxID=2049346 RepID=A0ABQ9WTS7_9EUKA|nr:hypothetical protein BLNAU_22575 [Blattamonas nauphoetae]